MQIRVRIPDDLATELIVLSPRARSRVVAIVVRSQMAGLKATDLVATHRNLQLLGHLMNQSLRVSHGRLADVAAVEACVKLLKVLTR